VTAERIIHVSTSCRSVDDADGGSNGVHVAGAGMNVGTTVAHAWGGLNPIM